MRLSAVLMQLESKSLDERERILNPSDEIHGNTDGPS